MKKIFFMLMIFLIELCAGCGNNFKHISEEEARNIFETEKNYLIVDVRTKEEYEKKHIPNSILIPVEDLREGKFEKLPDKNQMILIYCWTGRRVEDSAKILVANGYTNVYEFGGLVDWTGELEAKEVDSN